MEKRNKKLKTTIKIPFSLYSDIEQFAQNEGLRIEEMVIKILTISMNEKSLAPEDFLQPAVIDEKSSNLGNALP